MMTKIPLGRQPTKMPNVFEYSTTKNKIAERKGVTGRNYEYPVKQTVLRV
jgi:hypothetical protein